MQQTDNHWKIFSYESKASLLCSLLSITVLISFADFVLFTYFGKFFFDIFREILPTNVYVLLPDIFELLIPSVTVFFLMRIIGGKIAGSDGKRAANIIFLSYLAICLVLYFGLQSSPYGYIVAPPLIALWASFLAALKILDMAPPMTAAKSSIEFVIVVSIKFSILIYFFSPVELAQQLSDSPSNIYSMMISGYLTFIDMFNAYIPYFYALMNQPAVPAFGIMAISKIAILIALMILAPTKLKAVAFIASVAVFFFSFNAILLPLIFVMPRLIIVPIVANVVFTLVANITGVESEYGHVLFNDSLLYAINTGGSPQPLGEGIFVPILIPTAVSFAVAFALSFILIKRLKSKLSVDQITTNEMERQAEIYNNVINQAKLQAEFERKTTSNFKNNNNATNSMTCFSIKTDDVELNVQANSLDEAMQKITDAINISSFPDQITGLPDSTILDDIVKRVEQEHNIATAAQTHSYTTNSTVSFNIKTDDIELSVQANSSDEAMQKITDAINNSEFTVQATDLSGSAVQDEASKQVEPEHNAANRTQSSHYSTNSTVRFNIKIGNIKLNCQAKSQDEAMQQIAETIDKSSSQAKISGLPEMAFIDKKALIIHAEPLSNASHNTELFCMQYPETVTWSVNARTEQISLVFILSISNDKFDTAKAEIEKKYLQSQKDLTTTDNQFDIWRAFS